MLRAADLTLARGTRRLLEGASLTVHAATRSASSAPTAAASRASSRRSAASSLPMRDASSCRRRWIVAHVAQETPPVDAPRSTTCSTATASCARSRARSRRPKRDPAHDGAALADLHHRFEAIGGYSARARAATLLVGPGLRGGAPRRSGRELLRRLADAAQPRAGADVPLRPAAARRADQPPRPRRRAVARGLARAAIRARCCSSRTTATSSTASSTASSTSTSASS